MSDQRIPRFKEALAASRAECEELRAWKREAEDIMKHYAQVRCDDPNCTHPSCRTWRLLTPSEPE